MRITGLMQGVLCTDSEPTGSISLTSWAHDHREHLGTRYASELGRRTDRCRAYGDSMGG